jgi:hypothetical protein
MKLEIVTGTSMFTGVPCVAVVLRHSHDSLSAYNWAEKVGKRGRPATFEALNGQSEDATVEFLTQRWLDWAESEGLDVSFINKKVRRNLGRL